MSPNRLSPIFLQQSRSTNSTKPTERLQQPSTSSSFTMDKNIGSEPQSVSENAPSTPESQPLVATPSQPHSVPEATEPQSVPEDAQNTSEPHSPTAADSQPHSVPEVSTSPDSSITTPSVTSTEPSETSEPPRTDGPLSSLAQKAAETHLGRTASQNLPESVRPALNRANRVLNNVDEHLLAAKDTLDTDEGRRVVKSACELASSLIAFIAMLFATALSSAEGKLGMQPAEENLTTRFVKVCHEAGKRARTCTETRERQVGGSCEARVYAHARRAVDTVCSAFKSCLKGMSDFNGPGNEYVNPAAQKIISVLPKDMQVSVRQSKGPLKSLRNGLGLDSDACSTSQDNSIAETNETHDESSHTKVD